MAVRRPQVKEVSQLERDAKEFGTAVRCGGWRLGLLVARSVAPAKPGRQANHSLENESPTKVSMNAFAETAGVSVSHVKYYYDAWQLAAKAGMVPAAEKVEFGDDNVDVEADSIEVDENPTTHWSHFYQLAKNPKEKPKAKEQVPEDDPDADDESEDAVDEDFGIKAETPEPISEAERAEADSSIQRNQLLEILESVQSVQSRLVRVTGVLTGDNAGLIEQIASAAMDLSTTAMSMGNVEAKAKVEV